MKEKLLDMLIVDEDIVLKPYKCSMGYLTIGIGRNLETKGISKDEARYLAKNDIDECIGQLEKNFPWYKNLNEARQIALANMCFQLGIGGLLKFRRTLDAIAEGKYKDASRHMLDSLWANQTPPRARRIAKIMETGQL